VPSVRLQHCYFFSPSLIPLGFQPDRLLSTLSEYSAAAGVGIDSFQKSAFPVSSFDPNEALFVAQITPVIHYTLGGIQVSLVISVLCLTDIR
jgi:hypothetical protein